MEREKVMNLLEIDGFFNIVEKLQLEGIVIIVAFELLEKHGFVGCDWAVLSPLHSADTCVDIGHQAVDSMVS